MLEAVDVYNFTVTSRIEQCFSGCLSVCIDGKLFIFRIASDFIKLIYLDQDRQVAHLIPRFLDLYGQTGKQRDMAKLTLIVMLIKNMYAITK